MVSAATTQNLFISNVPQEVYLDTPVEIGVAFACTSCTTDSYFRGVLYTSGTSYFGYTQNVENTWVNAPGSKCTEYYYLSNTALHEGTWSGVIRIKADLEHAYYKGPGEYLLKVGRYSPSCSSPMWSNEVVLSIAGPTVTPTASVIPTVPPTARPSDTSTPLPSSTPLPKISPIIQKSILGSNVVLGNTDALYTLHEEVSFDGTPSPTIVRTIYTQSAIPIAVRIAIYCLLIFSVVCAVLSLVSLGRILWSRKIK